MSAFFKNWKCVRGGGQYSPLINSKKEGIERGEGVAIFPLHQLKKQGIGERRGGWQYSPLINSKNEGLEIGRGGGSSAFQSS